ncbi:IMPACT family protein [Halobellus rufus]|uniref:IMPACT family protein n=1 Tax=Halobellus rufus TaxID=1448860 RepID=UPI00067978F8|nr:YigZ family protein [Halobellus rufus]
MTDSSDRPETHPDAFETVAGRGRARFEIKGSEFIGYVAPANTVAEAESFVDRIRDRHSDATHNVPAYRVPASDSSSSQSGGAPSSSSSTGGSAPSKPNPPTPSAMLREYQSDDGEPTGSSGKPALNVLVQRDLRNVVAVVTRYYGGTNLGVGGLARAYSRAVKEAVDDAGVVETVPHETFAVTVEYDDSGTVRGLLESADVEFEAAYEADVAFEVRVPVGEAAALRDRIRSATSGRAEIEQ